jgi:hypothetical protein
MLESIGDSGILLNENNYLAHKLLIIFHKNCIKLKPFAGLFSQKIQTNLITFSGAGDVAGDHHGI